MKRPWAFICAATTTKSDTLRRYCRALYTLGYVPVCPPIQDGQYLVLADPTERADYNEIVREKILRCPLLVLCGQKTDATTNADSWGVPQTPVSKRFMKGHGDTHERI